MSEKLSVPRRSFDFEDYADILRRNIRWILAPAFAGLVLATVAAYLMQDTFVSVARIRVVPQQVPESLVASTSSQQLADHINAMAETIKSRATLTSLINKYGLYKEELKQEPLEDVIGIMNPAIKVVLTAGVANMTGRNLPAIQLSFSYRDRYLAQKVCQDIVSRFMDENLRYRMDNVVATDQFLNDEFDHARRDLDAWEQKLAEFRTRNAGRLPEQMGLNLSQMNTLEARLQGLNESISHNEEQRLMLESELRILRDRLAAVRDNTPQTQVRNERLLDLDHQIQVLETNIASMRDRYTDSFPDLEQARSQLAGLKKQRDDVAHQDNAATKPDRPLQESSTSMRERLDLQGAIEQWKTRLEANKMAEKQLSKDRDSLTAALKGYQGRVENVPVGEKEYAEILRDRDLAKAKYQEMELKRQRSAISLDMENRKQGETLEVLDHASLPESPTAPKRAIIIPAGAVAGLLFGVVLIAIREMKDTSLKTLKDARLYTQLTVLGSIPLLENDAVVQRRRRIMLVGWATATLLGFAVMAGSVARYYMNKV
jgi:protein tyrosine kinase modulator